MNEWKTQLLKQAAARCTKKDAAQLYMYIKPAPFGRNYKATLHYELCDKTHLLE